MYSDSRLFRFKREYFSCFQLLFQRGFYLFNIFDKIFLRWVVSAYAMNHSHSFLLLGFHFIYRYIAVAKFATLDQKCIITVHYRSQHLGIFRAWWFLLFLLFCFISESVSWFSLMFFLYEPEPETFSELMLLIEDDFPSMTRDGIAVAQYWASLKIRLLLILCILETWRNVALENSFRLCWILSDNDFWWDNKSNEHARSMNSHQCGVVFPRCFVIAIYLSAMYRHLLRGYHTSTSP